MRKFLITLFIVVPVFAFSQIQVIGGLGFLIVKQNGMVYVPNRYEPTQLISTPIERKLFTFGETMTAFVRWPAKKPYAGKACMGPQFGFGFYYTRMVKSIDPNYIPLPESSGWKRTFGPCHIPLEWAFHFGNLSNTETGGEVGMSISGGIDLIYLHVADEKAFCALPCTTFTFMAGKTGIRFGFHFKDFQSVYKTNLGEVNRITNAMASYELVRRF